LRENRGPWYLLTGFVLGAFLGLLYAWVVSPVEYVDTSPAAMRADFRDQYRALIASAYVANRDIARAQARLNLLNDRDVARTLAEQAQHTLADGGSPEVAQALALLALDLGQGPTPVVAAGSPTAVSTLAIETAAVETAGPTATVTQLPTESPQISTNPVTAAPETSESSASPGAAQQTPEPTRTSLPTGAPLPTRTPTAISGAPIVLEEKTFVCDQSLGGPLIQVMAQNAARDQISGIEVIVNWEGGENHFFTGLKPELGPGYADFTMTPGEVYTLRLAEGGQPVSDLTAAECESGDGSRYWGSWHLRFAQGEG
jgi:hypothetical protein